MKPSIALRVCSLGLVGVLGCACPQPPVPDPKAVTFPVVWEQAVRSNILYGLNGIVYAYTNQFVHTYNAESGEPIGSYDIKAPDTYVFKSSAAGVFLSDLTLAPHALSGFAWFGTDGSYKGRIVLPNHYWIPRYHFIALDDRLLWSTRNGYEPADHHGFVELKFSDLVQGEDGHWYGTPRVLWQITDYRHFYATNTAIGSDGDYYVTLYDNSARRFEPEEVPDRTYAAKVIRIDATTEEVKAEYPLFDNPQKDDGGALLVWLKDRLYIESYEEAWFLKGESLTPTKISEISFRDLFTEDYIYSIVGTIPAYCRSRTDLSVIWQSEVIPYSASCTPVLHQGYLYAPVQEAVYCYDASDGTLVGKDYDHPTYMHMQNSWSTTVSHEDLLILSDGSRLFALRMDMHARM